MGFFSINEHSGLAGKYEFPDIEGYCGTIGCGAAIVEGYQNDWALFEAQVYSDMHEMHIVNEGGDVEALQEASIAGMWEAIKKFFIKLGAKIKAIFKAFCAKIESYFTKDLKGFVKKYEKSLDGKDFKDMKVKCAKLKGETYVLANDPYPSFKWAANLDTTNDIPENLKDKDRSDMLEHYYNKATNNKADDAKSFDEWYHEELYEDEETHDDWDAGKVRNAASRLTANTKLVDNIDKKSKSILKELQKVIDNIDKEQKKITALYSDKDTTDGKSSKLSKTRISFNPNNDNVTNGTNYGADSGTGDTKYSLDYASNKIQYIRSEASAYQEVVMHISQTIMKDAKYGIAQDKKVFAAAVAYKKTTTEASLLDMIAECAEVEVEEFFNNTKIA